MYAFLISADFMRWVAAVLAAILLIYCLKSRRDILAESAGRFFAVLRGSIYGFAALLVLRGSVLSVLQYSVWQGNEVSRRLLPPEQPIAYFLGYAWTHFGKVAAFSLVFAVLLLLAMSFANRFSGGRFFYREEPWLAGFGALAAPWPAGFLVMMAVLAAGIFTQIGFTLVGRRGRLPLLWFWLPAALTAIIFGDIIGRWFGLDQFRA